MPERPYADAAKAYLEAGHKPFPVTGKHPPVKGATGREGVVSRDKVKAWRKTHGDHNLAIRHEGTVAIDVDEYGDKHGAAQLAELEAKLGPLSPTFTSTARGRKSPSRQHIYRVPEGTELDTKPAPDIEVCQYHHRYSVVWPSRHPDTGKLYRWYAPDGERLEGVPPLEDVPMLPEAWLEHLSRERAPREASADWEAILEGSPDGDPSPAVRSLLERIESADHVGHDDYRDGTYQALRLAIEGHPGVAPVVAALRERFEEYETGKGKRPGAVAREAERILEDGAKRAAAAGPGERYASLTTFPLERVTPVTLADCDEAFTSWLGLEYDLEALHAVLAVAAVERLDGDPAWLWLVSGSGNAKTETVQALAGAGARVVSAIASEGALLSATSKGERSSDATGGLLREIGDRGTLVVKDGTTLLSMDRTAQGQVFAALREIHDGRWVRNVGTDGGRSLEWTGRVVLIGAVTTAWDRAHGVIAAMGDRFVLVRMDSTTGRVAAGRKAIANTGSEETMRAELSAAAAGVIAGADLAPVEPDDREAARLLAAADVVTRARTAVDIDYRGNVVDSHAPEMPTRFAKQLAQVFRGAVAIGMRRKAALALAIRCARDSMPPLRLEILEDVAAHEWTPLRDVTKRVDKPRSTVDRQLQSLHLLGLLTVDEEVSIHPFSQRETTTWRYSLAEGVNLTSLSTTPNTK